MVTPSEPSVASEGSSLIVRDVTKTFPAANGSPAPVLDHLSLTVAPGEMASLVGPSGCGKSTLLRLIAGLDAATAGELYVGAAPITGPSAERGLVFQDPTLFPWLTVRGNIQGGLVARGVLRRRRAEVDEFLELVGLHGFGDAFPHQLSGGMAQRASLARALVNDPTLLILDEPLGKLDSLTRLAMQGELVRLWQRRGFTVLMVTHDVEEALLLSNRVIVFSDRPARLSADLAVDLPYPRHRDHPELLRLRRKALGLLGLAGDW